MSQNIFLIVKANVSIVDLIGQYTTLKRAGLYWKGRCPFHQEKTASFTVSPHIQIFHCFGCQENGDVIAFFAKIEHCSQLEAAKELAQRHGIDIGQDTKELSTKQSKNYYDVCLFFMHWCTTQLDKNNQARQYLHERGFTPAILKQFAIGLMPGGLHSIRQLLDSATGQCIMPDDLVEAGILMQGKSVFYSPYEERIIFPITDHNGRVCGFGGRTYKKEDERAKYYNSRDSDFFSKGNILFGLSNAKKSIQQTGSVFLVEGYTDCIAMVQHGFSATVATLGTACTANHLKILGRYASEIVIVYDGDNAGTQAMNRIAQLCWQANIEPFVVTLPAGHDPASLLAEKKDISSYIEKKEDIFLFFIKSQSAHFITFSLEKKMQTVKSIVETIAAIADPIKQDILTVQAAESLSIQVDLLKNELKKLKNINPSLTPPKMVGVKKDSLKIEKRVFVAIMNNVDLLAKPYVSLLISYLPSTLRTVLVELKEWSAQQQGVVTFAAFFDSLNEEQKNSVSSLLFAHEEPVDMATFDTLITQLKKKWWKLIAIQLKSEVLQAERQGDADKVTKLLSDFVTLQNQIIIQNGKHE